ncbi:MAG: restriction endonuclease, partial [Lachnoanaerobaculum sp.]|nr:restriction endonuclease [Lachnoanaerobaculum sp.]
MRQVLQVKEFEAITCIEDDKIKYGKYCISRRDFSDLIIFIKEYTAVEKQVDILQFMKIGYKRNVGESISFNNYVGIIELPSGIQIEILPKIDFGDAGEDRTRTKRVFLKMLRAMRDFEGKIFNDANLNVDNMNLYEIFINIYLQEV